MECTNPDIGRLITRYELGALEEFEQEMFVDHLIQCEYCHNEVYSMAPFMGVLREHREAVQRGEIPSEWSDMPAGMEAVTPRPFWLRRPVLAAVSVLVAVGTGLLAVYLKERHPAPNITQQPSATAPAPELAKGMPPPWHDVKIPKAAYTPPGEQPLLRSAEPKTAFEQAMMAYQQNNFAAAAERLEVVSRLEPEHPEAHFYWGVSLLLAGQSQEAIAPLKQAVQLNTGARRESSLYYLALAYLKTNQPRQALAELDAVIAMGGHYQAAAEKLKQSVVEALK